MCVYCLYGILSIRKVGGANEKCNGIPLVIRPNSLEEQESVAD